MNRTQEISTLRKAGRLHEALVLAEPALAADPHDLYLKRAVGWLFYDLIKREVRAFENQEVSRVGLSMHFDEWLGAYARGGKTECPSLLHSLLLTQVLKASREWPRFLGFARWWDPHCLRPEDRLPYRMDDGKTLPSLELRLAYAVGRAITGERTEHPTELMCWGADLVDAVLAAHPDDQWLHYYKSKRLMDEGCTAEAREHLLPVVRRQRHASWAWALLGRAWEADDADKVTTCYFRALQVAGKDVEVLKTRVALATLLARQERFAEAAVQVSATLRCRAKNGYRIPQDLARLAASNWYRRYAELPNLTREPDVAQDANELLFAHEGRALVYRLGVIDNQNPAKALAHVAFGPDDGAILRYRRMEGVAELPVGTCVEVGFADGDPRPVRYRPSEETTISGLCEPFTGELTQRPGQAFAFVVSSNGRSIYVPPALAGEFSASVGREVSCVAVASLDKHGRPGWKALRFYREGISWDTGLDRSSVASK